MKPTLLFSSRLGILLFSIILCQLIVSTNDALAQEPTREELQSRFDKAIDELRETVKAIRRAGVMHFHTPSAEAYEYREEWEKQVEHGRKISRKVNEAALAIFLRDDKPTESIAGIVGMYSTQLYDEGRLEVCAKLTQKLLDTFPGNERLESDLARIAIATNEFEKAQKMVDQSQIENFSRIEQMLFDNITPLMQFKREEIAIDKLLVDKEPRPQVKIEIKDKGHFIIELFEDEAPETVGNFIHLVESGHYDDLVMHPVMSHLLATTGTGTLHEARLLDYTIYDENNKPNRHHLLRGSVSMRTFGFENSSSSPFFVCRVPLPNLDSQNTVFGRVIEGMEVVDSIANTAKLDENENEVIIEGVRPDMISKATVLRKRKHGKYLPNKVKEE